MRSILLEAPQKGYIGSLKYSSPQSLFSPFQSPYEYDGNVSNEKEATPSSSFSSLSKISPLILLVIIVLAVIFFVYGLIHLVLWFLMKSPSSSSLYNSNRFPEPNHSRSLQRQLQQLFRLHDSGLDQAVIDALPIFHYQDLLGLKEPFDCAVCLCEFSDHDKLRLLPMCSHAFHMNCLDTWLLSNSTCPLCRATLPSNGYPLENPMLNIDYSCVQPSRFRVTGEEEDGGTHSQRQVTGEEQVDGKRVFSVRLGTFKNNGLRGGEIGGGVENSFDVRRCYSMGSYQYVVPDSYLQLVLSQDKMRRGCISDVSENGNVDGKRIRNRTEGGSFSVSKIWLWSKKSRYDVKSILESSTLPIGGAAKRLKEVEQVTLTVNNPQILSSSEEDHSMNLSHLSYGSQTYHGCPNSLAYHHPQPYSQIHNYPFGHNKLYCKLEQDSSDASQTFQLGSTHNFFQSNSGVQSYMSIGSASSIDINSSGSSSVIYGDSYGGGGGYMIPMATTDFNIANDGNQNQRSINGYADDDVKALRYQNGYISSDPYHARNLYYHSQQTSADSCNTNWVPTAIPTPRPINMVPCNGAPPFTLLHDQ